MAKQLQQKFLEQATGTDNSIDAVIADNVEVVKNMREVRAISIARLTGQDYTDAQAVNSIIYQASSTKAALLIA